MGKNRLQTARFFPAKRLSIFLTKKPDTIQKRRLFFSKDNFPAKRLSFFSKFFSDPFKSASFLQQKIFPAKRQFFFSKFFSHFKTLRIFFSTERFSFINFSLVDFEKRMLFSTEIFFRQKSSLNLFLNEYIYFSIIELLDSSGVLSTQLKEKEKYLSLNGNSLRISCRVTV